MSVFQMRDIPHGTAKLFFDPAGPVDIQRFETAKYPIFQKLLDQQESFFWRPGEVNLSKDKIDFAKFTEAKEHIFTSNLKRQILLDSVQGRAPSLCYGPIVSDPILEALIHCWTFFEGIHSRSYTHIIRTVYPNPSRVFDEMREIREIVECGNSVSKYYDQLSWCIQNLPYGHIDTKRAFWRSLVATNGLEALRFQISFACTFAFGQQEEMVGSSKIVGLIRQDESLHCAITQNLLKYLPIDDEDFVQIQEEERETERQIYMDIYREEKDWIKYLFIKGPMFGLSENELELHLDRLTAEQMNRRGLAHNIVIPKTRPLPWLRRWTDGKIDQPAPQTSEIIQYQTGVIDMNIDSSHADLNFDF